MAATALHGVARGIFSGGVEAASAGEKRAVAKRVVGGSYQDRALANYARMSPAQVRSSLWLGLQGEVQAQEEIWELMEGSWERLGKNMHQLREGASRIKLRVEPAHAEGEDASGRAKERAQFVREHLEDWAPDPTANENSFEDALYDLTDAVGKGVALQEILWELREGLILPRATAWEHPRYYGYQSTETRLKLRPAGPGGTWVEIPRDQFIVGTCKTRSGNPLGYGAFRILSWWWCAVVYGREWMLEFADQYHVPFRWATYDSSVGGETLRDEIGNMLEAMRGCGWGVFPAGTTLELKEGTRSNVDNPQDALVRAANEACDLVILGQTLTSTAGAVGSQALGTVHQDVLSERIQKLATWTANVLNYQLVPVMLRLNFGDEEDCPTLVPDLGAKENPIEQFKREVWKAFASDGTVVDMLANLTDLKELTRSVGLPVNEEYVEPWVPVQDAAGRAVTGEVAKDAEGDVVGGVVEGNQPQRTQSNAKERDDGDGNVPQGHGGTEGGEEGDGNQPQRAQRGAKKDGELRVEDGDRKAGADELEVQAADATEAMVANVLEELTSVEHKWLGDVKPFFRRLAAAAQSGRVSDAEFVQAIEGARRNMPELFGKLDRTALADALEAGMGAACANGAAQGMMTRGVAGRPRSGERRAASGEQRGGAR